MRNPFFFFRDLLRQPRWVAVWVSVLAMVNMASLLFWSDPVAKLIFVTFMVSAVAMMALYSYFGFEKILGAGHVFWLYLLPYTVMHIPSATGPFSIYLSFLSVFITISLVFDVVDVWSYFRAERS